MDTIKLDFEQARAKHLLFKSRLRAILFGVDIDTTPVASHHECNVGKWIYGYALNAYGHLPEMAELEQVHADIHTSARELIALYKAGKAEEALKGLANMEAVADKLVNLLSVLESKLQGQTQELPDNGGHLQIKLEEFQDILKANIELDSRIKQQVLEIEAAYKLSERKTKEAATAHQNLQTFFTQAPAVLAILSGPDHVFEMANPEYLQLVARTEAIVGQPVKAVFPELEGQGFFELLDKVYITGEAFIGKEMPITLQRDKVLEQRYINLNYQAFKDENSQIKGILVFAYDVTDHVKTRHAIEENKKKYHALFESVDQGFCILEVIFDEDNKPVNWRFIEVNPAFEKQNGLSNAEGKTMLELVPNLEKHWFEVYGNVALSGQPTRFEEGSEAMGRWFDLYAFPFGESGSKQVAVLFTDITERKKAEAAIKESEQRFRSLADNSPIMVFLIEPDPEAPVRYWNKTWLDYTGQTLEEAVGRAWDGIVHPDDLQTVLDIYVPAFQNREVYTIPAIRLKRKDGVYRWHLFKGNPRFMPDGEFIGYIGVGIDIDDQKKAEEAIRESEQRLKQSYEDLETKVVFRNLELEKLNRQNQLKLEELQKKIEEQESTIAQLSSSNK